MVTPLAPTVATVLSTRTVGTSRLIGQRYLPGCSPTRAALRDGRMCQARPDVARPHGRVRGFYACPICNRTSDTPGSCDLITPKSQCQRIQGLGIRKRTDHLCIRSLGPRERE